MARRGEMTQQAVLDALAASAAPMSAYDILAELRHDTPKIAPVTVYRALNALIEKGRIHRLESLNAYMLCSCAETEHDSILTICGDCGAVEENVEPDLIARLSRAISRSGFSVSRHVLEVHGTCADCAGHPAT